MAKGDGGKSKYYEGTFILVTHFQTNGPFRASIEEASPEPEEDEADFAFSEKESEENPYQCIENFRFEFEKTRENPSFQSQPWIQNWEESPDIVCEGGRESSPSTTPCLKAGSYFQYPSPDVDIAKELLRRRIKSQIQSQNQAIASSSSAFPLPPPPFPFNYNTTALIHKLLDIRPRRETRRPFRSPRKGGSPTLSIYENFNFNEYNNSRDSVSQEQMRINNRKSSKRGRARTFSTFGRRTRGSFPSKNEPYKYPYPISWGSLSNEGLSPSSQRGKLKRFGIDEASILRRDRRIRIACCRQDARFIFLVFNLFSILSDFEEELQKELETPPTGNQTDGAWKKMDEINRNRIDSMNKRWKALKQRSLEIRNRLESNVDHWQSILTSLMSLSQWVIEKDVELNTFGQIISEELSSLQKQIEKNRAFRNELEIKRPIIETILLSGRQHIANENSEILLEGVRSAEFKSDGRGFIAARQLTRNIRQEVNNLSMMWTNLTKRSDEFQIALEDSLAAHLSSTTSVSEPWERALFQAKVPYYINHQSKKCEWNHPRMNEILDELKIYNSVRFSAYRTALKLRFIQKESLMDKLSLKKVMKIFDEENKGDRLIDVSEIISTLKMLFKGEEPSINLHLTIDLVLNWILNIYDAQRTGLISNLSFKAFVVLLCQGPMEDKFRYLFHSVANTNKQVDKKKLGMLLKDCMQIPKDLGELGAFGGENIEPSVQSCFDYAGENIENIDDDQFLKWLKKEPQAICWLPVLHRISKSEGIRHSAKCNICKSVPIYGLRYRCLKCFNFDMCQECFLNGKIGKNHKLNHPMHEYPTESTRKDTFKDFAISLKNRLKSKRSLEKNRKLRYLPVQNVLEKDLEDLATIPSSADIASSHLTPITIEPSSQVDFTSPTTTEEVNFSAESNENEEHGLIASYCQSLPRSQSQIQEKSTAKMKDERGKDISDISKAT